MSDIQAAAEAKARGNEALKAGDYAKAISEYSTAIDLDPENAVYYSNRCAAYLRNNKSGDLQKALEDAENAISNKRVWPKGYSRKGTVCFKMGKWADAIEAFEKAVELDPNNSEYKANLAEAKRAKSGKSSSGTSSILANVHIALHAIVVLCTLIYLIPFVGGPVFFYHALKAAIVCQIVGLLRAHGTPKWSADYGRQLILNENSHFIMPCLFGHLNGPIIVILLPAVLRAAIFLSKTAIFFAVPPVVAEQAKKVIAMEAQLVQMMAQIEVGTGVLLIVLLATPQRSFIQLMMCWQYLRVRYMISYNSKQAFAAFGAKLDGIFYHSMCPGVIGSVWGKAKGFLAKMGDAQAAQNQKCSIM